MRTLLLALVLATTPALAADHAEAPGAAADPAADLADFFAFTDDGNFVAIVTFGALTPAAGDATYDADVLYGVHLDTDGDNIADVDVWLRFGQDAEGNWGVQASGIPGQEPVEGAVETAIQDGDLRLWAGLRDDPFFFDLAGFQDNLATGDVSFDSTRDSLAGTNVTAIVISGPVDTFAGSATSFTTWSTTARK